MLLIEILVVVLLALYLGQQVKKKRTLLPLRNRVDANRHRRGHHHNQ